MKDTISFRPLNQDTLPGSRHQSHCLNPSTTKINQEETKNHEKKNKALSNRIVFPSPMHKEPMGKRGKIGTQC